MSSFRALVIGGGNAGLALAQGLKKANIPCTIFERDSADDFHNKTRDWGMLLHWGAKYLEKVLPPDMQTRIAEPRVDNFYDWDNGERVVNMNGKTGEVILRVKGDSLLVRVSRKKLRRFLSEGLDIRCGKRLSDIKIEGSSMKAIFEDGTEEMGNFLVGADGSRSKVRQFLVGAEKATLQEVPFTMVNYSTATYTADQVALLRSVHPIVKLAHHPDNPGTALLAGKSSSPPPHYSANFPPVLDNPDPSQPELTKFQVYQSWKGPPYASELTDVKERVKYMKKRAGLFCEPFRTAGLVLSDDAVLPIDQGAQWAPIWWDNRGGMITLAGDAAHSMLPHRGQGLNNALQDVAEIVDAVKAHVYETLDLGEAIGKYEDEMRPRGVEAVELSLQTAELSASWTNIQESPTFKLGHNKA